MNYLTYGNEQNKAVLFLHGIGCAITAFNGWCNGKSNNSVMEMLYQNVSSDTITNACEFVYKFDIPLNTQMS